MRPERVKMEVKGFGVLGLKYGARRYQFAARTRGTSRSWKAWAMGWVSE
jgi:hypothetical protein